MPVDVKYRPALLGDGYVMMFHNQSQKSLPLNVKLFNPTFNREHTYSVVIDGGMTKEIGHLEGWTAATGDVIELHHAEYDTMTVRIQ